MDLAWYYPRLPDVVASHFNAAGDVNGWMPKSAFAAIAVGLLAMIVTVPLLVRGSVLRIPDSQINLPNKQYWLAPERREETLETIVNQQAVTAAALLGFLAITFHDLYQANLQPHPQMPNHVWVYLALVVGISLWSVVAMIAHFKRPL